MTHDRELFKKLNKSNIFKEWRTFQETQQFKYKRLGMENNLEVFKVHMKDKIFALDLIQDECATNKMSMKEGSISKEDKYIWKKVDVQVKKVDGGPHSNIHKRSNATTMKSTVDKEDDDDKRRNTKKNIKLKQDVMSWKKEKNKNYKHKKRRK